jgi:hypothetical protein
VSGRTIVGGRRTTVGAHGMHVALPPRWEARIYLRDALVGDGEAVHPVVHLGNFALPPGRGDYGSGAVERMRPGHAFISLLEFGAAEVGTPLFAAPRMPKPVLADFAPNALQRVLPDQLGAQRFFTEQGRPFCLYIVLCGRSRGPELVREVHHVLDTVVVEPR